MSKWDVIKGLEATIQVLKNRITTLETQQLTMSEIKSEEVSSIFNFALENPYLSIPIVTLGVFSLGYSYFFGKNVNTAPVLQNVEAVPVDNVNVEEQINRLMEIIQDLLVTQESTNVSNIFLEEIILDFMQEISIETLQVTQQVAELALIASST